MVAPEALDCCQNLEKEAFLLSLLWSRILLSLDITHSAAIHKCNYSVCGCPQVLSPEQKAPHVGQQYSGVCLHKGKSTWICRYSHTLWFRKQSYKSLSDCAGKEESQRDFMWRTRKKVMRAHGRKTSFYFAVLMDKVSNIKQPGHPSIPAGKPLEPSIS